MNGLSPDAIRTILVCLFSNLALVENKNVNGCNDDLIYEINNAITEINNSINWKMYKKE